MNRKNKRFLSLVLTFTVLASASSGFARNNVSAKEGVSKEQIKKIMQQEILKQQQEDADNLKFKKANAQSDDENKKKDVNDPDEIIRVLVTMDEQSTQSGIIKDSKLAQNSQAKVKQEAKKLEGATIRKSYSYLVNGFSMDIKRSEIAKISKMPGVKSVKEARRYYPSMTSAKELTQAYSTWKNFGYKGEGMVVSIVDTGIDVNHKDMRLTEDLSKAKIQDVKPGFTKKVPYGHNFADNNDNVKDDGAHGKSMHGMHVAGIVAANATDDEVKNLNGIQGVAPEAQLLAMKVFSNNPKQGSAFDDDIIAAIEDSVKHGADIINMSLGSPAGFQDDADLTQMAIKNATDHGTLLVIAAGNEGNSATDNDNSAQPTNVLGIPDAAIVGSPSTAKDALTVASYENSKVIGDAMTYTINGQDNKMLYVPTTELNPVEKLTGSYELVDCGDAKNFNKVDLTGKIGIVKRVIGVSSKVMRATAQSQGAAGLIIYSPDGDESTSGMFPDTTLIPAAWVGNSNGKALIAGIEKGIKISFKGDLTSATNPIGGDMSAFTSIGPAPNLGFKPDITAPGGNIYSTVNDNKYENMSGTSMATPHTAGAEALIMQGIKHNDPSIQGRALVELAKRSAINTAAPQLDKFNTDKTIPYSPRRQGAGMIQIENAVKNSVTVIDKDGNADVALRQIGKNTTFELTAKNYGSTPVTYIIDGGRVLTELRSIDKPGHFTEATINGATIGFDKKSITIAPKETVKLTVTINLPDNFETENFVEGFIKLNAPSDAKYPSLNVPYMGFYGDWSKPAIVDAPIWDDNSVDKDTGLVYGINEDGEPMYAGKIGKKIEPKAIAMSPNGDDLADTVSPFMLIMRNAKTMSMDIVKKDGDKESLVTRINTANNVTRHELTKVIEDYSSLLRSEGAWKGTIYDETTGKMVTAPDGQYYYKITSKVDIDNAKEQTIYMPLKVDTVAPEITEVSAKTDKGVCTLTWKATEAGDLNVASGLRKQTVFVNLAPVETFVSPIKLDNGMYTCQFKVSDSYSQIAVATSDNAANIGVSIVEQNSGINFVKLADKKTIGPKDLDSNGNFVVEGYASTDVNKITINGIEAKFDQSHGFAVAVPVKADSNTITVEAFDAKGAKIPSLSKAYTVNFDNVAPSIILKTPDISVSPFIKIGIDTVTVKGNIKDNYTDISKINFAVNDNPVEVDADGNFSTDVNVSGITQMKVQATDEMGNIAYKFFTVTAPVQGEFAVNFYNLSSLTILSSKPNADLKNNIYTVKGDVNELPDKFTINGKDVTYENNDGQKSGRWSCDVELQQGYNTVKAYAVINGRPVADYGYKVWYDVTAPEFSITQPVMASDGKVYTNKDEITIKGSVADNTFGYSLYVNGNNILTLDRSPGIGAEENKRTFEYTVKVSNGSKIVVDCTDTFGNKAVSQVFDVVVDKTAPVISITGVDDGKAYTNAVKPVITVDDNKAIVSTKLNGKVYNGEEIALNGSYELAVKAVDLAGNVATAIYDFSINRSVPTIGSSISVKPQAVSGNFEVKFTGNVSKSQNFDKIQLVDENGNIVKANFDVKNDSLIVNLLDKLQYQSKYKLVIPENALKDAIGNPIAECKYEFTTVVMPIVPLTPATPVPSVLVPATPVPSVLTPALPKTGSAIDMKVMMSMGCVLTLAGIAFLVFKKKEN